MNTDANLVKGLVPSHAILSPSDNSKILNFIDFNSLGTNTLKEVSSFRNSKSSLKFDTGNNFESVTDYSMTYSKLSNNYINNLLSQNNYSCGSVRQHSYSPTKSTLNNSSTALDPKAVNTLLNYNFKTPDTPVVDYKTEALKTLTELNNPTTLPTFKYSPLFKLFYGLPSSIIPVQAHQFNAIQNTYNFSINKHGYEFFRSYSPDTKLVDGDKNIRNLLTKSFSSNFFETSNKLNNGKFGALENVLNSLTTSFTYPHPATTFLGSKNINISYDKLLHNNYTPDTIQFRAPESLVYPFETFCENAYSIPYIYNRHALNYNILKIRSNLVVPDKVEHAECDFRNRQSVNQLEDFF
jgi:hypothetical protein